MSGEACGHPKDDGQPCGTAFGLCEVCARCFTHCEHRKQERTEARQRGAQRSNREPGTLPPGEVPAPPQTMQDVVLWYAWAIHGVVTGDLDVSRGNTLKGLLKGLRNALEAMESHEAVEKAVREFKDDVRDALPDVEAVP